MTFGLGKISMVFSKNFKSSERNMLKKLKFIYSEKVTILFFCQISTADLSYVVTVKSKVEISQNFVAFSEYMNFNTSYLNH